MRLFQGSLGVAAILAFARVASADEQPSAAEPPALEEPARTPAEPAPSPAEPTPAPAPPPAQSLRLINMLAVQMNPRIVGDELRLRYRHRLYEQGDSPLFDNFAGATIGAAVSASAVRPMAAVEIQPLAVLTLGVSYNPILYFGSFGLEQSYPSPHGDYGSKAISPPHQGPSGNYSLFVHQVNGNASVQAKVGGFVFRNAARMTYVHASPRNGDRVIYDPVSDLAVYRHGWVLQNDTDVGYMFGSTVAGLRHTLIATWYPSAAFAPGESHETHDSPTSRLGPIVAYTLFEKRQGFIDTANIAGMAQWYIAHRFRTGASTSAALPLIGVAFTVSGDLL